MKVLFTRHLNDTDLDLALSLGIIPEVRPLITTESIPLEDILTGNPGLWELLDDAKAIAFTSQNAVDALFGVDNMVPESVERRSFDVPAGVSSSTDMDNRPAVKTATGGAAKKGTDISTRNMAEGLSETERNRGDLRKRLVEILKKKPVYTVGETTADAMDVYGIMARFPEDYNGTTLARMMQNDGVHTSVVHFCGSIRRPEFGTVMRESGIRVYEIEVYRKQARFLFGSGDIPEKYFDDIKAVAFYSPSAVDAFFEQKSDQDFAGIYFAIGQTTAAALKEFDIEPLVPRAPTSELLIRLIGKMEIEKKNS